MLKNHEKMHLCPLCALFQMFYKNICFFFRFIF